MQDLFSLQGRVALVTGGARGIGAMIARAYLQCGVKVYISSRNQDELANFTNAVASLGECVAIRADLSSLEGIEFLVDEIGKRESGLDILVNNAGATWGAELSVYPEAGWDKVVDLNLKSPFFLTQRLLGLLKTAAKADSPSRVINIASVNGLVNPGVDNYAYSASKAGLIHLTRHLAVDLAPAHINVNAIAPGFFHTKMTAYAVEQDAGSIMAMVPRGRLGNQDDMAGAAIFLASRASSWITGHTLALDGGLVAAAG
jgi:NAD(P)-dependent dehydrogenase (short-subunit alcohol dehydrogenase family)